jgi:virginiamycin B lyase
MNPPSEFLTCGGRPWAAPLILIAALALGGAGAALAAPTIEEFPVPPAGAAPGGITSGPNGELWFTEVVAGHVDSMTTAGTVTKQFTAPGNLESEYPARVVQGPDGNLWFAEAQSSAIGRMTPAGVFATYPLPTANAEPIDITVGPDQNLWFTEYSGGKVGRITTSGTITEYATPTADSGPLGVTAGPDGNVWFVESNPGQIGRINPATASIKEFSIPGNPQSLAITAGPDGNLWFTAPGTNQVGRMTTTGAATVYPVPTEGAVPFFITPGPDGNLWFTELEGNRVASITTAGLVTEYAVPTANANPSGITAGPDGNIWFTEVKGNNVGKLILAPSGPCVAGANTLCIDDQRGDKRWKITSSYHTSQSGGLSGNGNAIPLTSVDVTQGGLFWFFGADNPEMLIKVLNGCGVNQSFWVFYAATTNVGFTVTVTDTKLGRSKRYSNADLTAAPPVQDTAAFSCTTGSDVAPAAASADGAAAAAAIAPPPSTARAATAVNAAGSAGERAACATTSTALCINGRFLLKSTYKTAQGGGLSGTGQAIALQNLGVSQGGLFWFFGATNPEMLIKVIDGCAVDNKYWVFYAATTNVGFTVTVTDTSDNKTVTYKNTDGVAAAPIQDTGALPCS